METSYDLNKYELLCVVVNFGQSRKIIKLAKEQGINGATVCLAHGTAHNRLLELLDLNDARKELILLAAEAELAAQVAALLNQQLEFEKPRHGIAFLVPISSLLGVSKCAANKPKESRGTKATMHNAIFVVVDKGNAEAVVDTATAAGARGATIINARGSGIHENQMLFAMAIEPEKEIVMILAKHALTETIVAAIREQLKIEEPGKGILFVMEVSQAYGLR